VDTNSLRKADKDFGENLTVRRVHKLKLFLNFIRDSDFGKMKRILTLLFVVILFSSCFHERSVMDMNDEQFTEYFKCPGSYATEEERLAAVLKCVEWAQNNHPDWTVRQFITFRINLLEKKG